jgi:hypothetical protein
MKSVIFACGLGLANASMKSLYSNIEAYAASHNKTGRGNRAFEGQVANGFEPINGYGCWCYLDDTWRDSNQVLINRPAILAHGKVVNDLDASCRDLINSYKCIEMDAEANGITDCDAQAVDYTGFSFAFGGDLVGECTANNAGDECAQNACIVEGAFTLRYIQYMGFSAPSITTHPDYSDVFVHTSKGGIFDPEVNCPGIPNPVGSDKECCGMHSMLTRHPYRLYSGFTTRSCCNGEVINNELNQCCNNAVIDINDTC